ncbi:hypothetical protein OM416_20050 [Paenibacillus sp. LS1]|uniref:hypothetical protein n=1 Tax=Paenibacillus sp. LS1 TaxID=2992120 RepID=UPI0022312B98|nr:hypothetical protein [Paenibacillus sp. LS1]MCW3793889.1 hypothetical protein [Paenibacillus sp. LS1]
MTKTKLTRKQVLGEKSTTQINRWVQEFILGWIPWLEKRNDYESVTFQKPGEEEPFKKFQDWEKRKERYTIIPYSEIDLLKHVIYGDGDFSTNISAAYVLGEHLRSLNDNMIMIRFTMELKLQIIGAEEFNLVQATPEQRCKAGILALLELS